MESELNVVQNLTSVKFTSTRGFVAWSLNARRTKTMMICLTRGWFQDFENNLFQYKYHMWF